jgi:hypothetical protein
MDSFNDQVGVATDSQIYNLIYSGGVCMAWPGDVLDDPGTAVAYVGTWNDADPDGDKIGTITETWEWIDPGDADSDDDGIPDGLENFYTMSKADDPDDPPPCTGSEVDSCGEVELGVCADSYANYGVGDAWQCGVYDTNCVEMFPCNPGANWCNNKNEVDNCGDIPDEATCIKSSARDELNNLENCEWFTDYGGYCSSSEIDCDVAPGDCIGVFYDFDCSDFNGDQTGCEGRYVDPPGYWVQCVYDEETSTCSASSTPCNPPTAVPEFSTWALMLALVVVILGFAVMKYKGRI